jgi:hypothetical protein
MPWGSRRKLRTTPARFDFVYREKDVKAALELALERLEWPPNQKARGQNLRNQIKPSAHDEAGGKSRERNRSPESLIRTGMEGCGLPARPDR